MKKQDWLQSALALASGAMAYFLWMQHRSEVHVGTIVEAFRALGSGLAEWVRHLRASFR